MSKMKRAMRLVGTITPAPPGGAAERRIAEVGVMRFRKPGQCAEEVLVAKIVDPRVAPAFADLATTYYKLSARLNLDWRHTFSEKDRI